MKHLYFLLCLCIFSLGLHAQLDTVYRITKSFDEATNGLKPQKMYCTVTNEQGDTVQESQYWWTSAGSRWTPYLRTTKQRSDTSNLYLEEGWRNDEHLWAVTVKKEQVLIDSILCQFQYGWDADLQCQIGTRGSGECESGLIEFTLPDGTNKTERFSIRCRYKWDTLQSQWYLSSKTGRVSGWYVSKLFDKDQKLIKLSVSSSDSLFYYSSSRFTYKSYEISDAGFYIHDLTSTTFNQEEGYYIDSTFKFVEPNMPKAEKEQRISANGAEYGLHSVKKYLLNSFDKPVWDTVYDRYSIGELELRIVNDYTYVNKSVLFEKSEKQYSDGKVSGTFFTRYDETGMKLVDSSFRFSNGDTTFYEDRFDEFGRLLLKSSIYYNGDVLFYKHFEKYAYGKNSDNFITKEFEDYSDDELEKYKIERSFTVGGMLADSSYFDWDGTDWVETAQLHREFAENGELLKQVELFRGLADSAWTSGLLREQRIVDEQLVWVSLEYCADVADWCKGKLYEPYGGNDGQAGEVVYSYDPASGEKLPLSKRHADSLFEYDESIEDFVLVSKAGYEYNADDQLTHKVVFEYDFARDDWKEQSSTEWYYSLADLETEYEVDKEYKPLAVAEDHDAGGKLYPTVASNAIFLQLQSAVNRVEICSLSGKSVLRHMYNQSGRIEIDVSAFNCGIYYVSVNGTKLAQFIKK